ncbi:hypothetical protein Tco_0326714 [Tanacetum coccineum]
MVDKKKVIITETSIRSDLNLEDAGGTDCLPTDTIFEELARMAYEKPSSKLTFYKTFFSPQWKFLIHTIMQCLSAKTTTWNEFNLATPTDSYSTPIITQPSSSKPQKKSSRKQRKDSAHTKSTTEETTLEENVATPSCDPPQSELEEKIKEFGKEKEVKNTKVQEIKEDWISYQEVTLVDETQEMDDDNLMFDTSVLEKQEIKFEKVVEELVVSVAATTKSIPVCAAKVVTTSSTNVKILDELTLAQTLIEIKTAKPNPVTSSATTTTTTRPKARGVVIQEPSDFKTTSSSLQASQLPQAKDKGKGIMVEPEVPLKKKDQAILDKEMARYLEAQLQDKLIEEERLARQKEEEANIALIESWDNTQAMMEVDFKLAQRLQAEEHREITIEERSRLFVELMNKRKKHFAKLRAEEIRRKPPTKSEKRNKMSTYLKNMAGYKQGQLKSKSYDEIQKLFDKEMKRVNTFLDMNLEVVKGNETRTEERSKRAWGELESDMSKKQKIDVHVEVEKDDQEEVEMKRHIKIVKDNEVAIDAIPLATKPPVIVDYKIDKDGRMGYFKLPEDDYERVLWGDLKVMFEPNIKSEVWRSLQGDNVTVWKLFDNYGVHFVRNLEIQKMNIKFSGGLLGFKDFKMILRVNTTDEAINEEMDESLVRAATTTSSLEAKVKKLEKKRGSRTYKLKRLYKVGRSTRVISSDEASLGDKEDASKQGSKIDDIDKDAEITLVDETQGRYGDEEMFDTIVLDDDEVLAELEVTIKDVNLSVDEVTLAQALAALKSAKVQEKANVVEEPSESITTTPTLTKPTAITFTAASTRPKAKGLVINEEEQETTPTVSSQQPSHVKA